MKHNAMTLQAQNNTNNNKTNRRLCRNISGSREVYQHTHMLRLNFVAQWINNNKQQQMHTSQRKHSEYLQETPELAVISCRHTNK